MLSIREIHTYYGETQALFGASFLILVDTLARTVVAPAEIPIGVITAFIGAPFFIAVLRRNRRTA